MKIYGYLAVLAAGFAVSAFAANTWYVDAVNGVDAVGRGASADNAFLTLQYAHDQATAGDTVMCAPGNYDQGYGLYSGHNHTNRLCVSKELHFVSTTPKAAHIVGKFDPDTGADGTNAVRCVLVTDKGYGTTFKNFTFRNGATNPVGSGQSNGDYATTSNSSIANGGGLLVFGERTTLKNAKIFKVYLIDCVVSNCVAKWGAGMHGGTAIRCLFSHNTGTSYGQTACGAALWNSVVFDNVNRDSRPAVGNKCRVVNCAIVGSKYGFARHGTAWNTVFSEITGTETNGAGATVDTNIATVNCIGKGAAEHPFVNPLGDWRLLPDVPGAETGVMSNLVNQILLPEDTAMTDFNGKTIDTSKTYCTLGPVQEIAANVSGAISVESGTLVNGVRAPFKAFVRSAGVYPQFYRIRPAGAKVMRYQRSLTYGVATFIYPDRNGDYVQSPPFAPSEVCTLSEKPFSHEYWCDPTADAELADGTEAHPYRTIQAAVDAGKAQYDVDNKLFVVNCRPGVYAEGSRVAYLHNNRVVIPDKCPVLIRSTEGPEVTIIKGAADPDAPHPVEYPGCGSNAIRCVAGIGYSDGQCALQGFTFADGHSSFNDVNSDNEADRVGGIYGKNTTAGFQVLDSVITNCMAVRGGAAYYGTYRRCRVYDCASYGGVFRYGVLVSCYIDPTCRLGGHLAGASQNNVIGTSQRAMFTTIPANDGCQVGGGWAYCSLFGRADCANKPHYGSVFSPNWSGVAGSQGGVQGVVCYAPESTYGLGAIYSASPGVRSAKFPAVGSAAWGDMITNLYGFADSDLNGRMPEWRDGRLPCGANFAYVDSVYVPVNAGLAASPSSANGIYDANNQDLSVTVSAASTGTRPCIGLMVNGETNLYPLASSITVTQADVKNAGGAIEFAGVYSPHWYVNADPEVGDDANSGFLPWSPKRTLAAAMSVTGLASGDTVHAAAGVYDQGSMDWETGGTNKFRVAVKGGVTLVADEGAEKTIIVGAPDTTDSANPTYPGFGPNAMHCVYLNANATLRGFTLTGGYTDIYDKNIYSSDWVVPVTGGGLCGNANGRDNAYAYDCIISNNYAYTGGGTRWVNAVNCRIVENHATADGGNTRESNLWGCYVNRGYQGTGTSNAGSYNITRNAYSTFGPDNWTYDGGTANRALSGASSGIASISNCVVLGMCGGGGAMTNQAYNTVFAKGRNTYPYDAASCHVVTDGMPGMFDAEGRPLPGCPAVDRGDRDNLPPLMRGIATDVTGTQRVYNGQIDVGALECDWRARYRADVGNRFDVTAATPDVVESISGTVLVNAGETISAEVSVSAAGRKYVLKFRVGDGAEAVVTAGDAETVYSTPGEQEVVFAPTCGTPLAVSVASRAGVVELVECRSNAGTAISFR